MNVERIDTNVPCFTKDIDLLGAFVSLVSQLLNEENCVIYPSAIEATPCFDLENWESRARALVSQFNNQKLSQ